MIEFAHYHGSGNRFLVVDSREEGPLAPAIARSLCATATVPPVDGVLCIEEGRGVAPIHMRILNADGSEPEMCGNGIRCVVKHAVERLGIRISPLPISTAAGIRTCAWTLGADGRVETVTVAMGAPTFTPDEIPIAGVASSDPVRIDLDGVPFTLACVGMGNPHAVLFGSASIALAQSLGPRLAASPVFPQGVNVSFAQVDAPDQVSLVVHERGCGVTKACGTAACATVVAAIRRGLLESDRDIRVALPGGALRVRVASGWEEVWMTGPAVHVADGTAAAPSGADSD